MSVLVDLDGEPPKDIAHFIHQMVLGFGQLEYLLALTMKRCQPTMSVPQALEKARKLWRFQSLAKEAEWMFSIQATDQHREGELKALLEKAHELKSIRDKVVHGLWCRDPRINEWQWIYRGVKEKYSIENFESWTLDLRSIIIGINEITRPGFLNSASPMFDPKFADLTEILE
tara:strand:+ start:514 stop:1032 length:519 start_codon:yes stop_codon:yes gene_type:complete